MREQEKERQPGREGAAKQPHNIILEGRRKLSVSGVSDVDSFDEGTIVAYTTQGELTVRGEGLHIGSLNVQTGELSVEGRICLLSWSEEPSRKAGLWEKLFR